MGSSLKKRLDDAEAIDSNVVKKIINDFSKEMDEARAKINKQRSETQSLIAKKKFG